MGKDYRPPRRRRFPIAQQQLVCSGNVTFSFYLFGSLMMNKNYVFNMFSSVKRKQMTVNEFISHQKTTKFVILRIIELLID